MRNFTAFIMSSPAFSPFKRFVAEVKIKQTETVPVAAKEAPGVKGAETESGPSLELGGAAGSRAETWKSAFKIISDRPLFGIGEEVLKMVFPRYETDLFRFKETFHVKQDRCHNSVFDVSVTRGIIALIIYMWFNNCRHSNIPTCQIG